MIEKQAREDIAFIRRAIEEGGTYACSGSPDMLVWGLPSRSAISAPTASSAAGRPIRCGPSASAWLGSIRCAGCSVAR